jgi:hypothetical protein
VVRELEFRFGLGKHSLNVDYAFVFAELILRKIWCYRIGGKVVARFKGGLISLPDVSYASALTEPFEKMYREVFSFEGRVLDVGGYLGETAFLFKKWGDRSYCLRTGQHKSIPCSQNLNLKRG